MSNINLKRVLYGVEPYSKKLRELIVLSYKYQVQHYPQKTPTKELENEIARCHNMQLAKKIQLNAAYGALSNKYFRWFDNSCGFIS